MFDNCRLYNGSGTFWAQEADRVQAKANEIFTEECAKLQEKLKEVRESLGDDWDPSEEKIPLPPPQAGTSRTPSSTKTLKRAKAPEGASASRKRSSTQKREGERKKTVLLSSI